MFKKNNRVVNTILITVVIMIMLVGCGTPTSKESDQSEIDINAVLSAYGSLETSEYILVHVQGGPVTVLYDDMMLDLLSNAVDLEKQLYVNVHQVQTLEPEKFTSKEITYEEAKQYDIRNAEILGKSIQALKEQYPNKKVVVYGSSYGALLVQEVIATYGTDIADGFAIVAGRLNFDMQFVEWFSQGFNGRYDDNGNMIKIEDETVEEKNMNRLAAGLGYNRYTEKLKKIDLSNVIYIYGLNDTYVGKLSDSEIDFLKSKNVVTVPFAADHSETIDGTIKEALKFLGLETIK